MRIGVVFPQTEIGSDPGAVRAYAQAVEALGYRHVLLYEHVLGADPTVHAPWTGPYDVRSLFHEPMVLFGFLAAVTRHVELASGVVVLPQRQTALVAKQAAEVDVLCGGRLRLGVGLGWNAVEYEALGVPFNARGRRFEEQVALLRRLWTEPVVDHAGTFDTVTGAGINPLPVQRPIPLWFGATTAPALHRLGRLADGWVPYVPGPPGAAVEEALDHIAAGARATGRDPAAIGLDAWLVWPPDGVDGVVRVLEAWRAIGATHVSVSTIAAGFVGVDAHIAALGDLAAALGLDPPRSP